MMDALRTRSHWSTSFHAPGDLANRSSQTSGATTVLSIVRNSTIIRGAMGFCQVMIVAVAVAVAAAAVQQRSLGYAEGRTSQLCSSKGTVTALEEPYFRENEAAMKTMMSDMIIQPTGDIDRDFVLMMTPHHQGAIAMAKSVLRYGRNRQIRRLAQEIIVTQQQEIIAMRLALGDAPSASTPSSISLAKESRRP